MSQAKLTYPTTANSGPTTKNSGGKLSLGVGTAAGAKDIEGQRAVLPEGGIQKERVIVSLGPGVGTG